MMNDTCVAIETRATISDKAKMLATILKKIRDRM